MQTIDVCSCGCAFELKYDSLFLLGFEEVVCILVTLDPPVSKLAKKLSINRRWGLVSNSRQMEQWLSAWLNL